MEYVYYYIDQVSYSCFAAGKLRTALKFILGNCITLLQMHFVMLFYSSDHSICCLVHFLVIQIILIYILYHQHYIYLEEKWNINNFIISRKRKYYNIIFYSFSSKFDSDFISLVQSIVQEIFIYNLAILSFEIHKRSDS